MSRGYPFTPTEDEIIRAQYGYGRVTAIRDQLAAAGYCRSIAGIRQRAQRLGVAGTRIIPAQDWTAEHDRLLTQTYGIAPTSEVATRLGRSPGAVRLRARVLGLSVGRQRARRVVGLETRLRYLRLLLAAQRGLLTWQQAADAAGLPLDTMTRRAVQEAARGAMIAPEAR